MKAGLQTFDKQGRLVVEITDRIPRIIGQKSTKGLLAGSFRVEGNGELFFQLISLEIGIVEGLPKVWAEGDKIYWLHDSSPRNAIIIYGRY